MNSPMSGTRWLKLVTLAMLVLMAGIAGGFVIGKHWPIARVERLRTKLFGPPPSEWTVFATTDLPRYEVMRVVHGSSLYIFSGFYTDDPKATARVEVLDLVTGEWIRKADIPQSLTHTSPVIIRDTVWFVGGFEGDHPGPATARVWRYDIASDRWSNGPSLPAPRGGGALVAIGDTLHFFGGWFPDRNTDSPDHWTLVVGDSQWTPSTPLPSPRGHLSAAVLNGSIYAIGGAVGHDPVPMDVARVDRFDLATKQWEAAPRLPFPVSHTEPATSVYDGRILVVGGRSRPTGRDNIDDVLLFDGEVDRWIHVAWLPTPLLGGLTAMVGDTLFAGLGAPRGNSPDNPLIWRTTLRNSWRRGDSLPLPLGEVAGGVIDGEIYLVGEGDSPTLRYSTATGRWSPPGTLSVRLAAGNHHAAEVLGGKLYLLGGFRRASEGLVQIYDPALDLWQLGPKMPFAAGSSASAVIDGKIYVAGGIVGTTTTGLAAVLDPATSTWTSIAPMPRPRNHAASGTDGKRLFVFGGRGAGSGDSNVVADGFGDVQIYDPATNSWVVSDGSDGAPASLPQARGGFGKAVWLNGEFWVIGGETEHDRGASKSGTYARVDIFDPTRNRWRAGPPLSIPRHGIFPLTDAGLLYVAGGGRSAGGSESNVLEILWPTR